jgi:putative membrane protein
MKPMKPIAILCSLPLFLAVPSTVAVAQELPSAIGEVNASPGHMTGQEFAESVMSSDLFEIDSGRLAANQAVSPELQHFGEQMADDHAQTTANLKAVLDRIVVGQYVTPPFKLDPRHMEMYNDLQSAQGPAFDELYVRQQLAAHRETVAVLQGYAANGQEAPLKHFAAGTLPIVQQHLAMLSQIRTETGATANR